MDNSVSSQFGKKKQYNVLLIGGSGVGKSCLKNRLVTKKFQTEITTVGVTSSNLVHNFKNKQIRYNIIDTAGQEQFKSINKQFYKDCFVVLFCFSGDSPKSLKEAEHYTRQFQVNYQNGKAPESFVPVCLFVRNKCDQAQNMYPTDHSQNVINGIADTYSDFKGYQNIKLFEVSAMEGTNTEELLAYITDELEKQNIFDFADNNGTQLANKEKKETKDEGKKCC